VSELPQTYRVEVAGVVRDLPLIEVAPGVRIAFVDCLADARLTQAAARALAEKLAQYKPCVIVTPEAKAISLAYAIAIELDCEYVTLRKTHKPYLESAISVETNSITSNNSQTLYLDGRYRKLLTDNPVILVDDVISTGSTLAGLEQMMDKIGAKVVARASIFTEGDPEKWRNVVSLAHLPVFINGVEAK
jgi:adenine phosphoribosyltransferase